MVASVALEARLEECLYLNVWTAASVDRARLPRL
jgi:hypothetical protein